MAKYLKGNIIKGTVTGIETYGIFVSFEDEYSGLIHISEISDKFVKNIGDFVELGEVIEVKILEVDTKSHHLKLSIKDFDYRINKKYNKKIQETPLGFTTLRKNLDKWVSKKREELSVKNADFK